MCILAGAAQGEPTGGQVGSLVNDTLNVERESTAFSDLEKLGPEGVPYIIGHLEDFRALPKKEITLRNTSPAAFEGLRHYAPETVHDALTAILNQVTGQSFENVYNGGALEVRQRNVKQWREWCVKSYPKKASVCEKGI